MPAAYKPSADSNGNSSPSPIAHNTSVTAGVWVSVIHAAPMSILHDVRATFEGQNSAPDCFYNEQKLCSKGQSPGRTIPASSRRLFRVMRSLAGGSTYFLCTLHRSSSTQALSLERPRENKVDFGFEQIRLRWLAVAESCLCRGFLGITWERKWECRAAAAGDDGPGGAPGVGEEG